ncbi:MAG: hypothetical protein HXS49_12245, partial [Theionarchaea archaeon]|nr:hypothetical protein [Theionarchaea archaeon]
MPALLCCRSPLRYCVRSYPKKRKSNSFFLFFLESWIQVPGSVYSFLLLI